MRRYFYSYLCNTAFSGDVGEHDFLLRCQPLRLSFQIPVEEHLVLPPSFWSREWTDCWGNRIVYGGTRQRHKAFTFLSAGTIVSDGEYLIPDAQPSPAYLSPTRLTSVPPATQSGSPEALCAFVHQAMAYQPQCTTIATTAHQALLAGKGVCQDFAHIMIGLCRRGGIPARYVVGLLEGEGETHAWVEVWRDGAWLAFDPTHDRRAGFGYIKIAHGRDAADCQVCRGLYKGVVHEANSVKVVVQEL